MRPVALFALFALSCGGDARGVRTLTFSITGPGRVEVLVEDEVFRCWASCAVPVGAGAKARVTVAPRAGAEAREISGACAATGTCELTMDRDASMQASFAWKPLAFPSAYGWRSLHPSGGFAPHAIDSHGNVVGSVAVPNRLGKAARYDFVGNAVEALDGSYEFAKALTDDGAMLLVPTLGTGPSVVRRGSADRRIEVPGADWASARGMSAAGWVLGTYYDGSPTGRETKLGHFVDDGRDVRTFGGPDEPRVRHFPVAINSSGRIVGVMAVLEEGPPGWLLWVGHPAEYTDGIARRIPVGPSYSNVNDFSDTNVVVGTTDINGPYCNAFLYDLDTGTLDVVRPLDRYEAVGFTAINASGTVAVGWMSTGSGSETAVVYQDGQLRRLDQLVTGLPPER